MIDPVSVVVAAMVFAAGVIVGRRARPKPPEHPELVCSCGHGYGSHAEDGHCLAEFEQAIQRLPKNPHVVLRFQIAPCPCRVYDGPEPLPRVWSDHG